MPVARPRPPPPAPEAEPTSPAEFRRGGGTDHADLGERGRVRAADQLHAAATARRTRRFRRQRRHRPAQTHPQERYEAPSPRLDLRLALTDMN